MLKQVIKLNLIGEKSNNRAHYEHKIAHDELLKQEVSQSRPAITSFDPAEEESTFTHPEQAIKILHQVLVQEKEDRFIRTKQNRIRAANFPQLLIFLIYKKSFIMVFGSKLSKSKIKFFL